MGGVRIGHAFGGACGGGHGWTACLGGALGLVLLPWAAQGDILSKFDYTVLRDGEPIGTHQVTVTPEGRGVKVEEKTDVEVTLGPLSLYRMEHLRHEIWRDGELERMTAHTNKNGEIYDIEITREPAGYKRVVNGRTDRFAPSVRLLTLWHEDLFKYSSFLSPMEDKTYRISVDFVGAEKVELIDRSIDAFVYRLSGDTNREIWYDANGLIMKVRLLDHSPHIEYVLSSMGEGANEVAVGRPPAPGPGGPVTRLAARR